MLFCALFPWAMFSTIFGLLSFSFHYYHDGLCWWMFVWCIFLTMASFGSTYNEFKAAKAKMEPLPAWHMFFSAAMLTGLILGVIFGCCNFYSNVQPYITIIDMKTYAGIDPAKTHGDQLLDAGRVSFSNTSVLDLSKSQGFKNGVTYCVAPIVNLDNREELASYDFWAVGTDCCESNEPSFRCGEYRNGRAHAGIRAVHRATIIPNRKFLGTEAETEDTHMFKLAAKQAGARNNFQVLSPQFFEWVEDPIDATSSLHDRALKAYTLGILLFFALQFFSVVMVYLYLTKK